MKPIFYFLVIAQIIVLAACQNWDYNPEVSVEGCLLRIEDESHQTIGEFTYEKNGLLKESWYHNDFFMEGKNEAYHYTFDTNNLLIEKKGFQPGNMLMSSFTGAMDKNVTVRYEYDSKKRITKTVTTYLYNEFPEINFETQLIYDYPDNHTTISSFNNIDEVANATVSKTEYIFNKDMNIEKIQTFYEVDGLKRVYQAEEYSYDTHHAPVKFEPGPTSTNNVLEKKITVYNFDEAGNRSVAYVSNYSYEYEYNSLDYPKKMTETWPNEMKNIYYYYYN